MKEVILSNDGTIPVIVANMEKAGLLVRKQDEKDRRKSILSLTEKGQGYHPRGLSGKCRDDSQGVLRME